VHVAFTDKSIDLANRNQCGFTEKLRGDAGHEVRHRPVQKKQKGRRWGPLGAFVIIPHFIQRQQGELTIFWEACSLTLPPSSWLPSPPQSLAAA
jgi:hypothetical protein